MQLTYKSLFPRKRWLLWNSAKEKRRHFVKAHAFKTACFWKNNRSFPQSNDMTRKTTKFCFSWPNKTLEISRWLRNITILLTERTIMSHSNLILSLSPLFYRMWRHFLVDDPNTKKVLGVAECSPLPLNMTNRTSALLCENVHRTQIISPVFKYV